jgi:cold shock CspA family protein
MFGRVTNYFDDRGFGFIMGDDKQSYFIRKAKLNGEHIQRGYRVFFRSYSNDRSDYNAKDVIVIESEERSNKHIKK